MSEKAASCPGCGTPIAAAPREVAAPPAVLARPEKTLYTDEQGVSVTTARIVFPNKTYSTANVTSVAVRNTVIVRPKGGAIALTVVGGIVLFLGLPASSAGAIMFGLLVAGLGVLWWKSLKDESRYHVFIGSASGEAEGLVSADKDLIQRIADSINAALVERG